MFPVQYCFLVATAGCGFEFPSNRLFPNENMGGKLRGCLPSWWCSYTRSSTRSRIHMRDTMESKHDSNRESIMRKFASLYAGDFHNERQRISHPELQYARKLHIPVHLPWLGDDCFFVKEVTQRANQPAQYRLRVAVFSCCPPSTSSNWFDQKAMTFRGQHYDFDDTSLLETELSYEEYTSYVQVWRRFTFTVQLSAIISEFSRSMISCP